MLFHSLEYAALLLGCAILCTLLPRDRRWIVLLAASGIFYAAWRIEYYALLLLTAASCHLAARRIADSADSATRWRWMFLAVGLNVGILFLFKYYGLFAGTAAAWTGWALPLDLGFLLPVGISFYTFQAIGYVADVYARRIEPERSLWRTVLFVSFFPQLVAGPIERAGRLLPALRRPVIVRWSNIRVGAWMFLWGLFKKVVIADRLALLVDAVFDDVSGQAPAMAVAAVIAFWFQIYCDFSGYTDMARGSARMFGIDLMQNFRVPYLATSLHDFWSRWHISLSTWFRDYVYIPLGGNRVPPVRWAVNILVVFAVSGLWHGANWTYLIWGVLHGAALIAEV
ncbi:MAG: MBOAT family protein, partial [Planctomycetota bacterium]